MNNKNDTINWHPWCDETFQKAKNENKAIFIFVGYKLCHLCNIMQEEVLNNNKCIDALNKKFICIKIDKDERPDLDKYYQKVYKLVNNHIGGWPTSVFCTPQNKPFFARTYISLESDGKNIEGMGFIEITELISSKISLNNADIYKNANEINGFLQKNERPKEATLLKNDFIKNFMLQVKNNYDKKNGGFSAKPKFPHTSTLNTLLNIHELFNDEEAKKMLLHTLTNMKKGGFYDLKNGGFYRYSIDESWKIPQPEKTLYNNALLCELYAKASVAFNDKSFLQTAKECADFWLNSMSEDKLFYSANDEKDKTNILIDKKIQTTYSSMMIKALFILGKYDEAYKQKAIKSLDALLKAVYIDDTLYHFTYLNKKPQTKAFLDDYAFLATTLIEAYNSTKNEFYLIDAQKSINKALERFYKNGEWNFNSNEPIIKADILDTTHVSAVSIMVDALLSLGTLLNDKKYIHFAFKTLEYNSYELGRKPILSPYMLNQMFKYLNIKNSF